MRLITLEEHYRSKQVDAEMGNNYFRDMNTAGERMMKQLSDLTDLGEQRIADMDKNGIDLQVLSHTVPSPEILEPARAIPLSQRVNDEIREAIGRYPARFAGFATLPMADPSAAAKELERAVKQLGFKGAMIQGISQGRFLDDPFFSPLLERAEALEVPLYLHRRRRPKPWRKPTSRDWSPGWREFSP